MMMLTKLETKSNRVKGVAFHPTRPWVLSSLHNGVIQLWDYRIKTLLERFDDHDGPVRGVDFHPTQPLFVSGGDDYKIKIWNYKQRRCLFTLLGHLDYIRTVQFHHTYPWILSCSDDQTIRIWNWQSRSCIAVLTGHNHYVMSAKFHPKDDLVVSASLDQTVRVWDISGLRKKNSAAPSFPTYDDAMRQTQDLFGNADVIVKYVLEGHERGVNWASFHHTLPLIVSGADDRQVKLWRMNDSKAWEVDSLRGHFNNVSCVLFHPRSECILSNSEDRTIRVWDMSKRTVIQSWRRENDRFWVMASHPSKTLFAAGHDAGMIVFKLERERPGYTSHKGSLFYLKDKYLRTHDFASARDVPLMSIRKSPSGSVRTMSYNAAEACVLLNYDGDKGSPNYELYSLPSSSSNKAGRASGDGDVRRGTGASATFVARNRFAVLDVQGAKLMIKNLRNETTKRLKVPSGTSGMFPAGLLNVILRTPDSVLLYDIQQRRVGKALSASHIKFAQWNPDKPLVALMNKDTLIIATKKLEPLCTIHEAIRIKSGVWAPDGVFVYTTLNHLKYALPTGDSGIIRTIANPIYLTGMKGNKVYFLDREGRCRETSIDATEYKFKQALLRKDYGEVMRMARPGHTNLIGHAIIAYLQQKGFPEVALHFVDDNKTKFNLAIECGNIEVAQACAREIDQPEYWHRLGVEALRQGNHQVVEMAYQRTKNFERLSFLYLITGNTEKLSKMLKIAEMRGDVMGRFHNSLYLGDMSERVRTLEAAGQLPLAYATAKIHGMEEDASRIAEKLVELGKDVPNVAEQLDGPRRLPCVPTPIMRLHDTNWPLLSVSERTWDYPKQEATLFQEDEGGASGGGSSRGGEAAAWGGDLEGIDGDGGDGDQVGGAWGDDLGDLDGPPKGSSSGDGGWDAGSNGDLDIDDIGGGAGDGGWDAGGELEGLDDVDVASVSKSSFFVPERGRSVPQGWAENSRMAVDHIAAGSFESAMRLLSGQVGICNFAPLKPMFLRIYQASCAQHSGIPSCPSLTTYLHRNELETNRKRRLPVELHDMSRLVKALKEAYTLTTGGKFSAALDAFRRILHTCLFLSANSVAAQKEVKELIGICTEYVRGLRMELMKKQFAGDVARTIELSAYFTHCNLQRSHRILVLRSAMNACHRAKNPLQAANFARRLLECNPKDNIGSQARKVIKYSEKFSEDTVAVDYDARNPFEICNITLKPIYKGSPVEYCPFTGAAYLPEHKGKTCPICELAEVGASTTGLQLTPE